MLKITHPLLQTVQQVSAHLLGSAVEWMLPLRTVKPRTHACLGETNTFFALETLLMLKIAQCRHHECSLLDDMLYDHGLNLGVHSLATSSTTTGIVVVSLHII